ncbi:MAG: flagellar hook-associated protein FlgL [bacterium]
MRITQFSLAENAVAAIQASLVQVNQLSQELSTGSMISDPSNNPGAVALVLANQEQVALDKQGEQTSSLAASKLDQETQAMQQAGQLLTQARTLMLQGANGTLTASDRSALAQQLQSTLGAIVGLANQHGTGGPLFSGTASKDPFVLNGTQVAYAGDQGTSTIWLSPSAQIVVQEPGTAIFMAQTDTATGSAQGSGPLGLSGTFTVDGTAVTVTAADTVASIASKINAIPSPGARASVAGNGALVIASLSTAPLSLADTSGTVLRTLGVLTSGGAIATETAANNAFDALAGAIQDLQANNVSDLQARVSELDQAQSTLGSAEAFLGAQSATAKSTQTTLQQQDLALQTAAGQIGGTDMAQVAVQYQSALTAYQAAVSAATSALKIGATVSG